MTAFTYLGSILVEDGDLDAAITHRVHQDRKTGRVYRGFCVTDKSTLGSRGSIQDCN